MGWWSWDLSTATTTATASEWGGAMEFYSPVVEIEAMREKILGMNSWRESRLNEEESGD